MDLARRDFLVLAAGVCTTGAAAAAGPVAGKRSALGIASTSYALRARAERARGFSDPVNFLAFCHERGAAGAQLALGVREASYTGKLRRWLEERRLYLEGSLRPPRDRADVKRFEAEVRTAREAGATVVRTVMLPGRRYETFTSAGAYREFKERSRRSLQLAEPVLARQKVRLAVENHKDFRSDELAALVRGLGSAFIGVCVDVGNNLALLEEPLATAEALAPWCFSCHLKDMAVEESADGFLLAEVPLGEGFLDLKRIVQVLRKGRPEVRFNLEMITRDPLRIPCLSEGYWTTFADVPGRDLARTLALVRRHARKKPLPRVRGLSQAEQVAAEERNVRRSLAWARERLGL
jgi:sugar phosphate isomerase/epimerase